MLDILDVAIGIIFLYLIMSLVASAAVEFLEVLLQYRARDLYRGVTELIKDEKLREKFYNHPLISSLFSGTFDAKKPRKLPSYIPSRSFAIALMDVLEVPLDGTTPADPTKRKTVSLPPGFAGELAGAQAAVRKLIAAAENDALKSRENIEEWFNTSMDRVSGWYRRRTHVFLGAIGLVAAIALNVDSIRITRELSVNDRLREAAVSAAIDYTNAAGEAAKKRAVTAAQEAKADPKAPPAPEPKKPVATETAAPAKPADDGKAAAEKAAAEKQTAELKAKLATASAELDDQLKKLKDLGLPIGWKDDDPRKLDSLGRIAKILGLLITAAAVSLGAPFWFDLLNKIIVVRSTVKPKEKSGIEASKDPVTPQPKTT